MNALLEGNGGLNSEVSSSDALRSLRSLKLELQFWSRSAGIRTRVNKVIVFDRSVHHRVVFPGGNSTWAEAHLFIIIGWDVVWHLHSYTVHWQTERKKAVQLLERFYWRQVFLSRLLFKQHAEGVHPMAYDCVSSFWLSYGLMVCPPFLSPSHCTCCTDKWSLLPLSFCVGAVGKEIELLWVELLEFLWQARPQEPIMRT